MEGEVPRIWLRLRLETRPDATFALAAVDHRGRTLAAPTRTAFAPLGLFDTEPFFLQGPGPTLVIVPNGLTSLLRELTALLPPSRTDAAAGGRVPLAVFVTPPEAMGALPVEDAIVDVLRRRTDAPMTVVLERPSGPPIAPFELPLDICLVGHVGADFAERLRADHTWLLDDPDVDLVAKLTFAEDATDAARIMRSGADTDVLVIDAWDATGLDVSDMDPRTRLAVVFSTAPHGPPNGMLPFGPRLARSVIYLSDTPGRLDFAAELFAALSHDRPIHEAAAIAAARYPGVLMRVVSSPDGNHDLRLTDAVEAIVVTGRELGRTYGLGRVESWAGSLIIGDVLSNLHSLDVNFGRESTGLWPLARAKKDLATAIDVITNMTISRREAERTPRRVVDIAIRRGAEVQAAAGPTVYVTKDTTLASGGDYSLEVQIGGGSVDTLLDKPPPPIDLLLPDRSEGHVLDVSVVGRGLAFRGPASQPLNLPRAGASVTIAFPFIVEGPIGATALARINVHHESRLLQTFRLEAQVTAKEEQEYRRESVVVRLQHSETSAWQNLDDLAPRGLSILVNQSPTGTHQLIVNKGPSVDDIDLDASTQADVAEAMRTLLATVVDPAAAKRAISVVRKLAEQGVHLYSGIFNRMGDAGRKAFRSILRANDQLIQIVRVDTQQVVPWALTYDWDPPGDYDTAKVCFGKDQNDLACAHGSNVGGTDEICVRGFWGIRHRVEEVVARLRDRDLPGAITVSAATPVVVVGIGTANTSTSAIPSDLADELGAGAIVELTAQDRLFDCLWDDDRRPALVLIVGHHKTKYVAGEPRGSRIATGTVENWLREQDITTKAKNDGDWDTPHPLVLLIACDSASVDARDLTSYILALEAAGAAGVVGTECEIKSSLARAFSVRFLTTLVNGLPGSPSPPSLAESLQHVRQLFVIDEEDVRGFAFTAFGTADTHIVRT